MKVVTRKKSAGDCDRHTVTLFSPISNLPLLIRKSLAVEFLFLLWKGQNRALGIYHGPP